MDDFESYCYSEEQVSKFMGITVATLRQRIYAGKLHPPYQCPTRGVYWFPRERFIEWAQKKLPVNYAVDNAS